MVEAKELDSGLEMLDDDLFRLVWIVRSGEFDQTLEASADVLNRDFPSSSLEIDKGYVVESQTFAS